MKRIIKNSAKCLKCKDEIVSTSVHDYRTCSCGNISVDGGLEYLKRAGNGLTDRSFWETSEEQIVLQCTIMSGASGSGKSTWIKDQYRGKEHKVYSADDFFIKNGKYLFDPKKLTEAHGHCLKNFIEACQKGARMASTSGFDDPAVESPMLVVDNTNTTTEEIAPYYQVAKAYGYEVELVTLKIEPSIASDRNTHNVPYGSVHGMVKRLQDRQIPRFWDIKLTTRVWMPLDMQDVTGPGYWEG